MSSKTDMQDTHREWPANGTESVAVCPVCGTHARSLLHKDLTDKIFNCAPGEWSMYQCDSCTSAYLDPRPTPETIGLAYQGYFTHDQISGFSSLSLAGKLRRMFANGYRNHCYGTQDKPASLLGMLATSIMPTNKAIIDAGMRHLPKAMPGQRLLDLGCGNSMFLSRARSAGWDVVGVDFDSKAVESARSRGLDVRLGGVDVLDPAGEQFDVITLAHVIEHVHRPMDVLRACYNLLKPGGFVWIETPNIGSEGYRLFGGDWRGLEPPRHLVLFSFESLCSSLSAAGFTDIETQPYRPLCANIFRASLAISNGDDPHLASAQNLPSGLVRKAENLAKRDRGCREFITLTAWKK